MSEVKSELLTSATQKAYFDADPARLEELWNVSNEFIETKRLICLEVEWYPLLEQHFFLSLLTCRDAVAKLMLKRIMEKFGVDSRRLYKLRTAYVRATQDEADFARHLSNLQEIEYDAHKVGMVSKRSAGDYKGYIASLVEYVDKNPVDAEAWAELGESYAHVGDYENAVASWDQVLILEPMAYNAFARIGELKRLQAATSISTGFNVAKQLVASSLDHLCRAVELNPLYLRGWCGIYLITNISVDPSIGPLNEKARGVLENLARMKLGKPEDVEAVQKILGFS